MNQIWKFPLDPNGRTSIPGAKPPAPLMTFEVEMPQSARILCVQEQKGAPCVWAVVNTEAPKEKRTFYVYGTGHSCDVAAKIYVGTVQLKQENLVLHVFESR